MDLHAYLCVLRVPVLNGTWVVRIGFLYATCDDILFCSGERIKSRSTSLPRSSSCSHLPCPFCSLQRFNTTCSCPELFATVFHARWMQHHLLQLLRSPLFLVAWTQLDFQQLEWSLLLNVWRYAALLRHGDERCYCDACQNINNAIVIMITIASLECFWLIKKYYRFPMCMPRVHLFMCMHHEMCIFTDLHDVSHLCCRMSHEQPHVPWAAAFKLL